MLDKSNKKQKIQKEIASVPDKFSIIKQSFSLLLKHPVLFIPKLFVAVLYGFGTLLGISLATTMVGLYAVDPSTVALSDLQNFFFSAIVLLVLTIFSYFVDLFFSGFYPVLVNHALNGRISFFAVLNDFKPRIIQLLLSGIILWLVITVISFAEAFVLIQVNFAELSLVASFAITFALIFLFYFLFPIIVSEKKGVIKSFGQNFAASFRNPKTVFIYSLIPFSVSVIKFVIAFFASDPSVLVVFWVLVILTGVVYTFHAVVNQLLYLKELK